VNADKKKKLEERGYVFTTPADFFGLSEVERKMVEMRHILTDAFRARRKRQKLSQLVVAKRMNTTQARVSKIETNSPEVSIEFVIEGLFALGCEPKELATCLE
jgi:hypothetical protein